jgi:hypothetical protein
MPFAQWRRNAAPLRHLDDFARRLRALERVAGLRHSDPATPSSETSETE